jgi:hypothetical protein
MYKGTIYIKARDKERLIDYLENTGWSLEEEEIFEGRKIIVRLYTNDYAELNVQFNNQKDIEIDGRESIIKDIDSHFNRTSTILRTDNEIA